MTGLEKIAEARFLRKRLWPQTEIIAKKNKMKDNYPNKLTDPLGL